MPEAYAGASSDGFAGLLRKPVDPDELALALAAVRRGVAPRAVPAAHTTAREPSQVTFKQRLYDGIHRLPRGRGLVGRWVERLPLMAPPTHDVVVSTVFGTRMRVNPSGDSLERSVWVRGIYEVPGSALLLSVLPKVKIFWDIGAHVGYHTLLASRVMGAGGQVFSFEPHPRLMARLRDNVTGFGGPNVVLLNLGLSDRDGEQEIFDDGDAATRAPTFVPGIYGESGHRCALRTGDGLVDAPTPDGVTIGHPDFIKIDIEGYEERAFRGMERLLSSRVPPLLMFELNETFNADSRGLLDYLAERGGYAFSVERNEARYPVARRPEDAPAAGFVPLCLDAVPRQCNVLGYRPDVHGALLRDA
jgi:FkbM family methyltransferase